ncbi:MAG: hypothetical protein ACXWFH_03665 [Solirubrobacterales bacterium]
MAGRGSVRLLAAIAAVAALASPLSAAAKPKKPKAPQTSVVTASGVTTADGASVTVTPTCPKGRIAVGGGFSTAPANDGSTFFDMNVVFESRRADARSWTVSAARADQDGTPGPALPVTASVHCLPAKRAAMKGTGKQGKASKRKAKPLRVTEATAAVTAPGNTFNVAASASCPAGQSAIGGGFSSSPVPTFTPLVAFPLVYANHRAGPGAWEVAFFNDGAPARTLTAHALCAPRVKPLLLTASAPLPPAMGGYGSTTAVGASCPKRKALIGGGFSNTPAGFTEAAPLPIASTVAGRAWSIGVVNIAGYEGALGPESICL